METETEIEIKRHNPRGRALGGLILVAVGVILLLKQMHLVLFPYWLFTWPMFFIALGLYLGVRRAFYGATWLVFMLIGAFFLIKDYFPEYEISDYFWPLAIIAVGLFVIFRPRRWSNWGNWGDMHYAHRQKYYWKKKASDWKWENATEVHSSDEDYIDSTSVFGGVHKVIVSKNFKGGDLVNIFGGCDIDFTQADFKGTVTLDCVQIFGGAKITVPPDWKIIIKGASVFGGVEDKRLPSMIKENPEKTLIIDGTSIFGGISILCY